LFPPPDVFWDIAYIPPLPNFFKTESWEGGGIYAMSQKTPGEGGTDSRSPYSLGCSKNFRAS